MDQTRKALSTIRPRPDDDLIDKLNYFWTAMILVVCSLTIAMRQYVGRPLQCWVPVEFKGFWLQYAEDYCFVENTYFVPMNQTIPETGEERVNRELGYYQWVPIILALQAFMFFLPRLAWGMLNTEGLNVPAVMDAAMGVAKAGGKQRIKPSAAVEKDLQFASQYLDDVVKYRKATKRTVSNPNGFTEIDAPLHPSGAGRIKQPAVSTLMFGYFTTVVYLMIKLAYIGNVVGQFFLMNRILAPNYNWWGIGILSDLLNGQEWHDSGHFPRVTLCDFTVRKLGQLQTYTIQCVLLLNMLNEKMYLFLWWWFLLVAVLTVLNWLYWTVVSFSANSRRKFVAHYLLVRNKIDPNPRPHLQQDVKKFVDSYLKPDGVLLLRLVSSNAGEVACANMVQQMWQLYSSKRAVSPKPTSPDTEGFIESPNSSLISEK